MSKKEFLEELRIALSGRVAANEVTDHLRYYEDYINTQIRLGNREEDVVADLGDPRLLARNIADVRIENGKILFQNITPTARIAPSCTTTRNISQNAADTRIGSSSSRRIRCPVLDTGSHSVMPSTTPYTNALSNSINTSIDYITPVQKIRCPHGTSYFFV